jgi:sulfite reductase (NADPH) flavoprotein alpha-component
MLPEPKLSNLQHLVRSLSRDELIWLNGYLTGLSGHAPSLPETVNTRALTNAAVPATEATRSEPITPDSHMPLVATRRMSIVYGTETGNSKKLAGQLAGLAKQHQVVTKLVSLEQYKTSELTREENFFVIISTQGDGEPPKAAKKFYDYVHNGVGNLGKMNFSVLALGDRAYPLFCKAGEDVFERLQSAGAKPVIPLTRCDAQYTDTAQAWFQQVMAFVATTGSAEAAASEPAAAAVPSNVPSTAPAKTEKKYYQGTVAEHINLNDKGSQKQTFHIELACEEQPDYQPGDAVGIVPENDLWEVEKVLTFAKIPRSRTFRFREIAREAEELFTKSVNIMHLPLRIVQAYARMTGQRIPDTRMNLADLLRIYPLPSDTAFEDVLAILEPISPRLYSVSSAPSAHPGEIHLTVAHHRFQVNGENKFGLCAHYLAQLRKGQRVNFYVHRNQRFRLPESGRDMIMIGPGTGIAPFRAFLAERNALGATGRSWLFFGEQHFVSDFLYQTEIQDFVQTGALHKVSLAWSRDTDERVYVQHRIRENGAALWEWLQSGASVYVCGSKDPMSIDVEQSLLDVIVTHGAKTETEAREWLNELETTDRYVKDVY